jgi:hypothetical protein
MTGHFTTLDGCERWGPITEALGFYRVPIYHPTPFNLGIAPVIPRSTTYSYRLYELESMNYSRGLAEYKEVTGDTIYAEGLEPTYPHVHKVYPVKDNAFGKPLYCEVCHPAPKKDVDFTSAF